MWRNIFVLLMPTWFACGDWLCGEFAFALLMPARLICVFEFFVLRYSSVAHQGGGALFQLFMPVWGLLIL